MKKIFVAVLLFVGFAASAFSQSAVSIQDAISGAAMKIAEQVPQGSLIAVLNLQSESANLSDHVIGRLIAELTNTGKVRPVMRGAIELKAAEMELKFQDSGYVSERDQIQIGQALGANMVVTGTIAKAAGNTYRLTVNAINLNGLFALASYTGLFYKDAEVTTIVDGAKVADKVSKKQAKAAKKRAKATEKLINDLYRDREKEAKVRRARALMGAMNMFFGWGILAEYDATMLWGMFAITQGSGLVLGSIGISEYFKAEPGSDEQLSARNIAIVGGAFYFGSWLAGWIAPIFLIGSNGFASPGGGGFPIGIDLVSTNDKDIGVRLTHTVRF
jgi:hypothetical protein